MPDCHVPAGATVRAGRRHVAWIAFATTLAGCNHAQVDEARLDHGGPLARPDRVIVLDVGVGPGSVRLDEGVKARLTRIALPEPPNREQAAAAEAAARALTDALVQTLRGYGLRVERSARAPARGPEPVGLVEAQILFLDQGNETRRRVIGFGAGASRVAVTAQLFHQQGEAPPRELEAFEADADSGRRPGAAIGAGAALAARAGAIAAAASAGAGALGELRSGTEEEAREVGRAIAQRVGAYFVSRRWLAPAAVR